MERKPPEVRRCPICKATFEFILGKTYIGKVTCSRRCGGIMRSWGDWMKPPATYKAAHNRITFARGPASDRTCRCGATAKDWAYVGPRDAADTFPFSGDFSHYEALCRNCHRQLDQPSTGSGEQTTTTA